jgi:phosphonate transport system substrate-binding protein
MNARTAVAAGLVWLAVAAFSTRAATDPVVIRLGVMAEEPTRPDRLLRVYAGVLSALRARLAGSGVGVGELLIARDVEELAVALGARRADFVIETAFPTFLLRRRLGSLEPVLVVVRRGEREYRSVFFTRRESPIRALADLRGRTLVLQALRSTSAFAQPRAELQRAGLTLVPGDQQAGGRDVVRYTLAGAEINQGFWVASGRGDAGAFNAGDWQALPAGVRERLRVFHETQPLLRGLVAFRAGIPAEARAALLRALTTLHESPDGRQALEQASGITRFEALTPMDRTSLREWERVLSPAGAAP